MSRRVYAQNMVIEFEPWLHYPDLTSERLSVLAALIRDVRCECVALHEPDKGDGNWCLGSRVYQRTYHRICELARAVDWLTINWEHKHLQFSFSVGFVPLRFYKGDPEDPPSRYLFRTPGEDGAVQLHFEFEGIPPADTVLRLAVTVDSTLSASRVSLVEINEFKEVERLFQIPFDAALPIALPRNVTPMQSPPVNLPPVVAEPVEREQPVTIEKEVRVNAGAK